MAIEVEDMWKIFIGFTAGLICGLLVFGGTPSSEQARVEALDAMCLHYAGAPFGVKWVQAGIGSFKVYCQNMEGANVTWGNITENQTS